MNVNKGTTPLLLSNNDQKILKALTLAVSLGHESTYKPKSLTDVIIDSALTEPDFSLAASKSTALEDSGCSTSFSYRLKADNSSLQLDRQYILLSNYIQQLNTLCNMHDDKKKYMKDQNQSFLEQFFKRAEAVLSESILSERLHKISHVLQHIQELTHHLRELKRALRNELPKNSLKVKPSCQRFVVQFFQMSSALIANIENDLSCLKTLDRHKTKKPNRNEVAFMRRVSEETSAIQRRLDLLTDFREDPLFHTQDSS